jgi:hypothetical protein
MLSHARLITLFLRGDVTTASYPVPYYPGRENFDKNHKIPGNFVEEAEKWTV